MSILQSETFAAPGGYVHITRGLLGPAQQHHAHYKCIVYYEDVKRVGWPVPHTLRDEEAQEVIYIDHNHLHMVGNVDTGANAKF